MHVIRATYSFDALHALKRADEVVEGLHPHTFRVDLELSSDELDALGCVMDFHELDRRVGDVLGPIGGTDLGVHPMFEGRSPSAEVIAQVLFRTIGKAVLDLAVCMTGVTVWEDDRHAGIYREGL